jgi:hypothetical protein
MKAFVLLLLVMAAGCATQGRLTGADLDLRDPQQIEAGRMDALTPYLTQVGIPNTDELVKDPKPRATLIWWEKLLEQLPLMKCRFRLIVIEWKDDVPVTAQ